MRRLTLPFLLLGVSLAAHAQHSTPEHGLMLHSADSTHEAPLLNTDVDIIVNGPVARVSVSQSFRNDSQDWVEGVYAFPLPDGAAVDRMRLRAGERLIEGEIREKQQARQAYRSAMAAGKKATLVEQQRANLFTTRVANIAPGETVAVEIEYLDQPTFNDGRFALRFPMTVTPRFTPGPEQMLAGLGLGGPALFAPQLAVASTGHRLSLDVFINAGMPIEHIASRYHAVSVSSDGKQYHISLADRSVAMDADFELSWQPLTSADPRAALFSEMVDGEPHYLLMVTPPDPGVVMTARIPREMLFIIDTSSSMHGASIQQATTALQRALTTLQPGDLFNVIEFNSDMRALFPNSVDASSFYLEQAAGFVGGLRAEGGTNMAPALQFALNQPPHHAHLRQIVFITDGAVGNEEALFALIQQNLGASRLFTVGIGSAPNSWFMRRSAELGKGSFTMIGAIGEVASQMDALFEKIERPRAKNIHIDWPAGVEMYPSTIPDLYAGEPVTVRVRSEQAFHAGSMVRVTGDTAGGGWLVDIPVVEDYSGFGVGALWARAKIASLFDEQRRGADAQRIRGEVVQTALKHRLVSRYTSLVAVDRTPQRDASSPLKTQAVPSLMPRGTAFPQTATAADLLRAIGLAILAFAMMLWMWQQRSEHRALRA
ncbi:MAG: marine proteobacterial sortase target protein [Pseudomonadota bacterium]